MRTLIIATALIMSTTVANALTLKSGEVLTSDGQVMAANETPNGIAQLEDAGFLISGGKLFLKGDISIDLSAIAGKSKGEIVAIIGFEAAQAVEEAGGDLEDAQAASAAVMEYADAAMTGAQNGHTAEQVMQSAATGEGVCITCD